MLSYHAIGAWHDMQAERPVTTDRRSGTRAATTFRKLPSASPGRKTIAAATPSNSRPGRVAQDDVVPQRVPLRRVGRLQVDGQIDADRRQVTGGGRRIREHLPARLDEVIGPEGAAGRTTA